MEEKIERLKLWFNSKAGPFLIEIWPTNRCNLQCIMCGTWASRRKMEEKGIKFDPLEEMKNEVSEERLLKLVREAKELGAREFLITGGGEPFIRKATTLKLMNEIKSFNLFGNLNTNGTLLNEEDIRKIIEIGWDMLMFSIDAPYSKTHDYIRGMKGCFQKVKENLILIKKEKKRVREEKPKIVFNTVLSNKIYDKVDKLIKFASKVGCEDITFIPLIPYDEEARKIELNEKQKIWLKKKIENLISFAKKFGINTNLSELDFYISSDKMDETILKEIENSPKDLAHSACFEPFLHFLVKADGEATFCCMIENSPENIKEKSLEEIWFGKYFNEQRRNFIDKNIREECKFCVFSQFIRNRKIREMLEFSSHTI
jgi:MoaA/NifB/PqqE/SkfB family radical SAM enzyme